MISKTIGFRGTRHFQTNPYGFGVSLCWCFIAAHFWGSCADLRRHGARRHAPKESQGRWPQRSPAGGHGNLAQEPRGLNNQKWWRNQQKWWCWPKKKGDFNTLAVFELKHRLLGGSSLVKLHQSSWRGRDIESSAGSLHSEGDPIGLDQLSLKCGNGDSPLIDDFPLTAYIYLHRILNCHLWLY